MPNEEYLKAMVHQATCRIPSVYSATFFAQQHISIIDQQSRCFNLCWSLASLKRIRSKHHVAIIGGGITGMTCAVALAAWTGCLVTVFERDNIQLKRFRRAAHRFIHPDLNHRGGENGHLSYDPTKQTPFPFMNWHGNYAPAFAEQLISKFNHYRSTMNIALQLNVTAELAPSLSDGFQLRVSQGTQNRLMKFDSVILATGFGEERLASSQHTNDTSYWLSGNPLSYKPSPYKRKNPERVLISGNGDSAVIEIAHVLLHDFDHENILSFLPSNSLAPQLSMVYASGVSELAHRKINSDYFSLCHWFDETKQMHELNPKTSFYNIKGFDLRRELYAAGISAMNSPALEDALQTKLEELASYEIKACLEKFALEKIFRPKIKKMFRKDVEVVVVGRTPTMYSIGQAPLNWFLLRLLSDYGSLTYAQTQLKRTRLVKNLVRCEFTDRSMDRNFDRVITRHGPDYSGPAMNVKLRTKSPCPSGYIPPPERFFSWVGDHKEYRTRRLLAAQRRSVPMSDEAYPGSILEPNNILKLADNALSACHGSNKEQEARNLFRRLKRTRNLVARSNLLGNLISLQKA